MTPLLSAEGRQAAGRWLNSTCMCAARGMLVAFDKLAGVCSGQPRLNLKMFPSTALTCMGELIKRAHRYDTRSEQSTKVTVTVLTQDPA